MTFIFVWEGDSVTLPNHITVGSFIPLLQAETDVTPAGDPACPRMSPGQPWPSSPRLELPGDHM